MSNYYISMPMNVFGVNLMSNAYVVGLPSLTGINGFVTSLHMDATKSGVDFELNGWAVGFHEVTPYESKPGLSVYTPSLAGDARSNKGASDEFKPRGFASLVLYLDISTDDDISSITSFLNKRLPAKHFCSGNISIPKGSSASYCERESDKFVKLIAKAGKGRPQFFIEDHTEELTGDRLKNLVRQVMRPKPALHEGNKNDIAEVRKRVALLASSSVENKKALEALVIAMLENVKELSESFGNDDIHSLWDLDNWMSLAYPKAGKPCNLGKSLKKALSKIDVKPKSSGQDIEQARIVWEQMKPHANKALALFQNDGSDTPYTGYMVPVQVGFVAISRPEQKPNVRLLSNGEEPEHCYVEPQIGLARMRSHYSVLSALKNDEFPRIFWGSEIDRTNPDHPGFYITGY